MRAILLIGALLTSMLVLADRCEAAEPQYCANAPALLSITASARDDWESYVQGVAAACQPGDVLVVDGRYGMLIGRLCDLTKPATVVGGTVYCTMRAKPLASRK